MAEEVEVGADLLAVVVLDGVDGHAPGRRGVGEPFVRERGDLARVVERVRGPQRVLRQELAELDLGAAVLAVGLHDALDELEPVDAAEDGVRRQVRRVRRLDVRAAVVAAERVGLVGEGRLALAVDDGRVEDPARHVGQRPAVAPRVPDVLAERVAVAALDAFSHLARLELQPVLRARRLLLEPERRRADLDEDEAPVHGPEELRLEARELQTLDDVAEREPRRPRVVGQGLRLRPHAEAQAPVPGPVLAQVVARELGVAVHVPAVGVSIEPRRARCISRRGDALRPGEQQLRARHLDEEPERRGEE